MRRRRRRRTGVREGVVASLAVVVFRGMLGGRFPRGLCYRLGRMTSPRYQILNLLAPAAYPRQGIQTFPPTRSLREPRVHGSPLARHRCLPSKPTPSRFTAASRSLPVLLAMLRLLPLHRLARGERKDATDINDPPRQSAIPLSPVQMHSLRRKGLKEER